MNIFTTIILIIATLLLPTQAHVASKKEYPVFELISDRNIDDRTYIEAYSTCFFISSDIVITNYHVVKGFDTFKVEVVDTAHGSYSVDFVEAAVLAVDKENDLALLKLKSPNITVIPLKIAKPEDVDITKYVRTIGFHDGKTQEREGTIVSIDKGNTSHGKLESYTLSIESDSGNSGSPVINDKDEVIGVIWGHYTDGNKGLAVTDGELYKFVDNNTNGILKKGEVQN